MTPAHDFSFRRRGIARLALLAGAMFCAPLRAEVTLPAIFGDHMVLQRGQRLPPTANPTELQGFAVAGVDGKYVWAGASVVGDEVLISAPGVPQPVSVRYAWADSPLCNLYNREGLPAAPFRTDDFPVEPPGR